MPAEVRLHLRLHRWQQRSLRHLRRRPPTLVGTPPFLRKTKKTVKRPPRVSRKVNCGQLACLLAQSSCMLVLCCFCFLARHISLPDMYCKCWPSDRFSGKTIVLLLCCHSRCFGLQRLRSRRAARLRQQVAGGARTCWPPTKRTMRQPPRQSQLVRLLSCTLALRMFSTCTVGVVSVVPYAVI